MNKISMAIGLVALLGACTIATTGNEPDCFQYQSDTAGVSRDSLTQCGPTVAAIAVCNSTGNKVSREQMRAVYPKPEWWGLDHIMASANRFGTGLQKLRWRKQDTLENLWYGEYLILHVDGVHFITVFRSTEDDLTVVETTGLEVWDSNSGIYSTTPALLKHRVTFPYHLKGVMR